MSSLTEENYLKALFTLSGYGDEVYVADIARSLHIKMPTVNSMIKRLAKKQLVHYRRYHGVQLTEKGKKAALLIIRKHRLAELFLVKVMGLGWEEVHEIAEQLEHIQSPRLFARMDDMLQHPRFDPHGDPIPDPHGKVAHTRQVALIQVREGTTVQLKAVTDNSFDFLSYLNRIGLKLGSQIRVLTVELFDQSMKIQVNRKTKAILSRQVAERLLVEEV